MKPGAIILLLLFLASCTETNDRSEAPAAASITVAEAQLRDLSDAFSVSSEVIAYRRSYVASRISGLIEEVFFEEGQHVNKGDVLARMDVRQQQTELRRANAALAEAADVYDRNQSLFASNAISRAEYLTSQRNLEQAESEAERLELEIEFGEVKAPIDGVVTARLVEIGNSVSVNERMFTVADMNLLVIRPGVSELNLTGLEEGQPVEVYIDVYPGRIFRGSIRRIFPGADAESGLFTVEVELHQDEDKPMIRPGFLARVRFAADDRREVLTVPSEAIVEREDQTYVFQVNENQNEVTLVPVTVGIQRDGFAEIRDGINAGAKVAAANLDVLDDGTEVRVVGTFRRHGFRN
jgi:membrane fusion protein (multidrug efflux system)